MGPDLWRWTCTGMLSAAESLPAWQSCPGCHTCSCRHVPEALPRLVLSVLKISCSDMLMRAGYCQDKMHLSAR